ncbi:hypothetical protein [Lentilactobacillus farraginis]|uniref:Uncharacterized protein n=1 Tax=Lentilactobacillus farraginis DSM 18382 = JCM 14108 TaxID=1423743 RepID=X0PAP0_9LACO|nr:hypothetical protein [Lentilactobacillus farraginis]KRM12189.1 hypothetical protein FD41_GL000544 [Lentilactobacillus farraginis DSM 18382 = JCM 14108]GAF36518.1 hypothetical protein JCM14108_1488 [Lentilactobacillus farraginis DSM 18382 = JCM 14108]
MQPFKKPGKEPENFLKSLRFIDPRDFQQFKPDASNDSQTELIRIKRVHREYRHEIRREKAELRIIHFKLFLLGRESLIRFIRHMITGRNIS